MKKDLILWTMAIVILGVSSGCASIMCHDEKTINVKSTPPQANYTIQNKQGQVVTQGTTPANVSLKRGSGYFAAGDYTITVEKLGYKKVVKPVNQGLEAGWYLGGNIIFGGLIGWVIVDPITGAMWDIKDVDVTLEPEKGAMLVPQNQRPSEYIARNN